MSGFGVPHPPPPLPLSLSRNVSGEFQPKCIQNIVLTHLVKISNDKCLVVDVKSQVRQLCLQLDVRAQCDDVCYLSFTKHEIKPVLQDGQTCGLVALSMASQTLCSRPIPSRELLDAAVKYGYTKQGEMFSAEDLSHLASSELHCSSHVVKGTTSERKMQLIKHLMENNIVIIPYDRDCNNEPCLKQGQKAHWAVLCGMVLCTKDEHKDQFLKYAVCDEQVNKIHHVTGREDHVDLSFMECQDCRLYVLAMQGKSHRSQLWDVECLLESNGQLRTIDPGIADKEENYIIKDLDSELNAKFIVLA